MHTTRRASAAAALKAGQIGSRWPHKHAQHIAYAAVDESKQDVDEVQAETKARVGWDPAGILPPLEAVGTTDHFARRARQRRQQQQQQSPDAAAPADASSNEQHPAAAAYSQAVRTQEEQQAQQLQQQQQQTQQPQQQQAQQQSTPAAAAVASVPAAAGTAQPAAEPEQAAAAATSTPPAAAAAAPAAPAVFVPKDPYERIQAKWLAQGGIPAADTSAYDRPAFLAKLAEKFIPIDLDFPGLRIVNFDPAVFTVEGFMTPEECASWQQHAVESGCLQQSKIGGGNAAAAAGGGVNAYGSRRTSSSLLMDPPTQAKSAGLTALMQLMQARGHKLLAHLDSARSWGPPGKLPAGGQYCYESPQVARYLPGQHFLSHEDAFPALLATANGFQRHATLLLYLNDVQQGGATHFDHLGISVQPRQGMALLFFPSYANGTADPRSLHTAQDAVDEKWVMQQWVARGYPVPKAVLKAVKVAALAGPEVEAAASAADGAAEPVREVFRVPVSSISSSSGGAGGGAAKKARKKSGSKKGFSRR